MEQRYKPVPVQVKGSGTASSFLVSPMRAASFGRWSEWTAGQPWLTRLSWGVSLPWFSEMNQGLPVQTSSQVKHARPCKEQSTEYHSPEVISETLTCRGITAEVRCWMPAIKMICFVWAWESGYQPILMFLCFGVTYLILSVSYEVGETSL